MKKEAGKLCVGTLQQPCHAAWTHRWGNAWQCSQAWLLEVEPTPKSYTPHQQCQPRTSTLTTLTSLEKHHSPPSHHSGFTITRHDFDLTVIKTRKDTTTTMDLLSTVRKTGSRGGVNFTWDDVATSQYRENYLGHSLKAPVGRWAKGRDLNWYAKADPTVADSTETEEERAARERREEIRAIKEAEEDAIAKALGLPITPRNVTGANAVEVDGSKVPNREAEESKEPKDLPAKPERRDRHRESDRHRDPERRHRKRHRSRDRDRERDLERSRSRHRRRDRSVDVEDREYRQRRRSRSPEHGRRKQERRREEHRDRGYRRRDERSRSRSRSPDRARRPTHRERQRSRSRERHHRRDSER